MQQLLVKVKYICNRKLQFEYLKSFNMAYPFGHIEHKVYPNTFLENTSVSIFTAPWNGQYYDGFDRRFAEAMERDFQLKIDPQQFRKSSFMNVEDEEQLVTYLFYPDKAQVRIARKKYVSFDKTVIPLLSPMKSFVFGVMGQKVIENLLIRKLNVFPIQGDSEEDVNSKLDNIYGFMFKDELVKTAKDVEIPENAPWIMSFRKAVMDDDETEMTIRIGISKAEKDKMYNVILDSSVKLKEKQNIVEGAIDQQLRQLNDELFDAFHWSVNNSVLSLMQKEVKA